MTDNSHSCFVIGLSQTPILTYIYVNRVRISVVSPVKYHLTIGHNYVPSLTHSLTHSRS
jgi:hypothetical protein